PALRFYGATFAPDGRAVAVPCDDGAVLVCDVTGLATAPRKLPMLNLQPADLDKLRTSLASDDGLRSHRALWTLVAGGGKTVAALQKHVHAVKRIDSKE